MRKQYLKNVCNGMHIWNLNVNPTEKELIRVMGYETKGILIVEDSQYPAMDLLRKLRRRKEGSKLWARRLCNWSNPGTGLWIVRRNEESFF